MRRIVSIWMFQWRTDWRLRAQAEKRAELTSRPFALVAPQQGGDRLTALNAAARAAGLDIGMLLTDARARMPELYTEAEQAASADRGLKRLAEWCLRFTPLAAIDPPDGIFLDITGCAHLFGGEKAMLREIARRMRALHLQARIAVADTAGAAFAAARAADAPGVIIRSGEQKSAIAAYPIACLRIDPAVESQLRRLGLKTIGQLYEMPRAPLTARFGKPLLTRLDQALGAAKETLTPLQEPSLYTSRRNFLEPVSRLSDIEVIAGGLAETVAAKLKGDGLGARQFILTLFGARGSLQKITLNTAQLLSDADKIKALFRERIAAFEGCYEPGDGSDAIELEARRVEPLQHQQEKIDNTAPDGEALDFLFDRIKARMGAEAVSFLALNESHVPERAFALAPRPADISRNWTPPPRPLFLFPQPEPITVTAQIPDGPPAQFTWRRVRRRIIAADGPERLASEWWRYDKPRTRDYFRVEDESHRRFWLFRDGLYGAETPQPKWYIHGVFP